MRSWNNNAYSDAQVSNKTKRITRHFSDLDLFFTRKPSTSDVNIIHDVVAIKRSVRNLILLNHHEKPFHPEIGGGVRGMLFQPLTIVVAQVLSQKIRMVIDTYEPRVELEDVMVVPKYSQNAFDVNILFNIINAPRDVQTIELMLERLR
jgi:phage baseplate assembly protein W